MTSTFLVTGGAGFIGSHIVDRLVDDGHRVTVLDNLSTGKRENLAHHLKDGRVELIEGDLREEDDVARAVEGVDYISHQAALPSVPRSVRDPLTTDAVNVAGTLKLFIAAKDAGVKRIVQAGSSSVYGGIKELPKVETMPFAPLSPYAVSKATGELYGRAFYSTYGLEYVALRYFNVFGPRQDPSSQYSAVLPKFIACFLRGESPTIFGDGKQSRDFTYVENVVQANLLACTAEGAAGRSFNVGCGDREDLLGIVQRLNQHFGVKLAARHEPDRVGDVKHSLADIGAARSILGYDPPVDFVEGLARTIAWHEQGHAAGA